MKKFPESNLIKIPAKDVVDELYGAPPTEGDKNIAKFRKNNIKKPEKVENKESKDSIFVRADYRLNKIKFDDIYFCSELASSNSFRRSSALSANAVSTNPCPIIV